jgi:integrase
MFPERSRDRFLGPAELKRFFAALKVEQEVHRDFYSLAILTDARRGNLETMRWADVDFVTSVWRIPETKAGVPVVVPLSDPAMAILRRRHAARKGTDWVFACDNKHGHVKNCREVWESIIATAKLSDLRPHDLRRTLGSWQAISGSSLPVIGKSLGHTSQRATMVYARLSNDAVRQSVERATDAILAAATGGEANG